jgi:hypothetical protein
MKALKDNCVMTNFDVDLSKEDNNTLKTFFENNRIIALFDTQNFSTAHFSGHFKLHEKSIMYDPKFASVAVKGSSGFFIYVTKTLLNTGNIIKLRNDFYIYNGSEFEITETPHILHPHMEGLFGFRMLQVGTISVPIQACYPKIISAHDAHFHLVSEKENTVVHIIAELPKRYSAEKYFDNLVEIGKSIMPQTLEVEVSLSATVRKKVR